MPKKITFDATQTSEIIKLYNQDRISCKEIGKLYNCSKQRINFLLKENKIELRDYSHCQQKYEIDECVFDVIDTPEKAYWLGVLTGDGSITERNDVSLSLQIKDKEHIEKFKEFMKSTHPIRTMHNKPKKDGSPSISCYFYAANRYLASSLRKYGICEDKTHKAIFPNNIPQPFMSNYMLGLIDSDGGFKFKKDKNGRLTLKIAFVGTNEFSKTFQKILSDACDLELTKLYIPKKTPFLSIVEYGGNKQLLRICKYLYSKTDIFLPRKKKKSLEHLINIYPNDIWLQEHIKTL